MGVSSLLFGLAIVLLGQSPKVEVAEGRFIYPGVEMTGAPNPGEPFSVWRVDGNICVRQGERFTVLRSTDIWVFIDSQEKRGVVIKDGSSEGVAAEFARKIFPLWPGRYGFAATKEQFLSKINGGFGRVGHEEASGFVDIYELTDRENASITTTWMMSKTDNEPVNFAWVYCCTPGVVPRSMSYLANFRTTDYKDDHFAVPRGIKIVDADADLKPLEPDSKFKSRSDIEVWLQRHEATRWSEQSGDAPLTEIARGAFVYPSKNDFVTESLDVWRDGDRICVNQGQRFTTLKLKEELFFIDHKQKVIVEAQASRSGIAWRHARLIVPVMPGTFGLRNSKEEFLAFVKDAGVKVREDPRTDPPTIDYENCSDPEFPGRFTDWSIRTSPDGPETFAWWCHRENAEDMRIMGYLSDGLFKPSSPPDHLFEVPTGYTRVKVDSDLKPIDSSSRFNSKGDIETWLIRHHALSVGSS